MGTHLSKEKKTAFVAADNLVRDQGHQVYAPDEEASHSSLKMQNTSTPENLLRRGLKKKPDNNRIICSSKP
jgi:hypothetical protein